MTQKINDYVAENFRPNAQGDVVVTFHLEAPDFRRGAGETAAESSIGTWTEISTMKDRVLKHLAAKAFYLNEREHRVKIAYPAELFEEGNMPQLLSSIAGNIFGMKSVSHLRLEDVQFPQKYINSFPGPQLGIAGVRKLMGTDKKPRPHMGTIVKPKVGLNPKETAKVAYEAWVGGIDFVKDDENLTSQKFCAFDERVAAVLEAKEKAEAETGEKKMYAANITAPGEVMLDRAKFVKKQGGNCIMVDVVTAGFSGLQSIRKRNFGMVIHGHRAMHAAFTRDKRHGIAMLPYAKFCRLCGVDQLHIGAAVGKMEGGPKEVLQIHREAMQNKMGKMKPVFSVCSGGLDPTKIPRLIKIMGKDIVIQAGGGIHGHPDGTRAGATALRQAVNASLNGVSMGKYALFHPQLRKALEKWAKK